MMETFAHACEGMLNGESGRSHCLEAKIRTELQLPDALGACPSTSVINHPFNIFNIPLHTQVKKYLHTSKANF